MLPVRCVHRASLLLSAVLFLSCSESPTENDETRIPASLDIVSGDEQNGVVGAELANPLVVRVEDANGLPVIGQLVNFRVTSGGGSVFAGSGLTNALGIVQDRWTLGTSTAEIQRVEARAVDPNSGAAIVFATFRATPLPGPAQSITKAGGDAQTGALGTALTDSLAVRATDAFGNPVPNVQITWAASVNNGTVSPATSQTNAQGIAKTRWTLGSRLDIPHSVTATSGTLAPATFSVTPALPASATIVKLAGDGASSTVGLAMAESLAVRVQLADGQVVPGVQVSWNVTSGNGTIAPQASVTQSTGIARARLTPGNIAGANVIAVSVAGLTAVQFTVTGTAGAPASLVKISGDGQQGTVGQSLSQPLVVRLTDQFVNPIVGATVGWEVVSGGGAVTASSSVTDASGHATIGWTLGNAPGAQQAGALFPGLASVTFIGHANVGAPSGLTIVSGNGQTGVVGTTLAQALVVRLTDALGNPIPSATVSFTVTAGGGTVAPSATTDANGEARASWALGGVVGTQSVTASAGGASVSFIATGTVGAPATIAKVSGDGQTGTIGQALAQPLVVRVQDQFGNDVPSTNVVWTVLTGGGTTSPPNGPTDAGGQASTAWTLGAVGGTHSVRAQVGDNVTTTFTASALAPGGSTLLVQSGDGVWARVGMEVPLVARLVNSSGQPIAGVSVTWTPSRGTANPASSTTDVNGDASTRWTLGTVVETATLVASATGANSATFSAHVRPGPVCRLAVQGSGQTGIVNRPLPAPLRLTVTDRHGNPTGPASVSPASQPGNFSGALHGQLQADSNGVSEPVVWALGSTVGQQYKTFSWIPQDNFCTGGGIIRDLISANALAAATVTISPDSARLFVPNDSVRFSARVTDGSGSDVPNAEVTWTTLDPSVASVNNSGLARAVGNGTARIVASSIGVADTALLRVAFERSVRISPSSDLVQVGDTVRFTATALDASGHPIPGALFTWSSTNEAIATVDGFGLVRGHAAGSSTIRAVSEGDTGTAVVTVTATLTPLTGVSVGGNHACGLLEDERLVCWGYNGEGEVGDGTSVNRATPAFTAGGLSFARVDAGAAHTCGLTTGGEAYCWGYNSVGALGDGTTTTRLSPVAVSTALRFDQIAAGNTLTCALASGRAYCWGFNSGGAVGDGTTTHRQTPTAVSTALTFARISATAGHGCAITSEGAAHCWGGNSQGELGDGSTTNRFTPGPVMGSLRFTDIAVEGSSTCGLTDEGRIYCWGRNTVGEVGDGTSGNHRLEPTLVAGGLTFTALAKGPAHACGITTSGAAYCWGFNPNGELGDGTTTTRLTPTPVSGGLSFSALSAGSGFTCGLTTTRATYCWGNNQWGQLGDGTSGGRSTVPVRVALPQ